MKPAITLVDVSPRDGLQNEQRVFTTQEKLDLIDLGIGAGIKRVEVTSFVNPKRVPQMADADQLCADMPRREGVEYIGLVLNMRGAERALAADLDEFGAVCVASDTFAGKNQGQTRVESGESSAAIVALAKEHGKRASVTIGASFGCPFEGEVPHENVVELAKMAADAGADEISLADTIGVGDPWAVRDLFGKVREVTGDTPLRAHFHNTRNTGIANAFAAIEAGVTTLDASFGGIGGCPFAPAATGNISMEDLLYMLERGGYETGVSLDHSIAAGQWLADKLPGRVPAMLIRAGGFPTGESEDRKIAAG
ncbi:MAG: hydroxymethylglutaryl-CoA lyase [Pseudomonadota bacterium]